MTTTTLARPAARTAPGWLRDPLVAFLAVGAVLFLVHWGLSRRGNAIDVPVAVQTALAADYRLMHGRDPDATQRGKLIDDYVADEILFREAVARGLHLTDRTTRARLVDRLRFLIAGAPKPPTEADMIDYYAMHGDYYRAEPQITLDQIYFAHAPADPAAVLAALRAGRPVAGDDFWMGRHFPNYGESMLRGMFGERVLDAARTAPVGIWTGPLASPRGVHFIRVAAHVAPARMRYTDVRDQVRQDLTADRSNRAVAAAVARLEQNYVVHVAD